MSRPAFTLIELLVVITVIVAIAGMSYPTITWMRHRADIDSTVTLINAVSATIGGQVQRQVTFEVVASSAPPQMVIRPLWDFNGDGYLDGDPGLDDHFSDAQRSLAKMAGYRGFIGGTRAAVPQRNVDAAKRVIDPWGSVLRIDLSHGSYGSSFFGIWSPGPDGVDGTEDDIRSWKKDG